MHWLLVDKSSIHQARCFCQAATPPHRSFSPVSSVELPGFCFHHFCFSLLIVLFFSPDVYSSSSFVPVFYLRVVASYASSDLCSSEGIFPPDRSHFDAILIIAGSDKRYAVTHALKVNILPSKVFKDQRGLVSKLAALATPEGKTEQDRLIYQG